MSSRHVLWNYRRLKTVDNLYKWREVAGEILHRLDAVEADARAV